jgi:hypothetical protein
MNSNIFVHYKNYKGQDAAGSVDPLILPEGWNWIGSGFKMGDDMDENDKDYPNDHQFKGPTTSVNEAKAIIEKYNDACVEKNITDHYKIEVKPVIDQPLETINNQ